MRRWWLAGLALVGGMLVNLGLELQLGRASTPEQHDARPRWPPRPRQAPRRSGRRQTADRRSVPGRSTRQSAYWPGDNYKPFELHTIATLEKDGVLSKAFSSPEHLGTHLDAPNHFEPNQPSVDQIPPEQLFAPGSRDRCLGGRSATIPTIA